MHRSSVVVLALVLGLGLPSCKKQPEDGGAASQGQGDDQARVQTLCEGMNDLSLLYVAGVLELEIESLEPPGTRETVVTACKGLSLDVVECAGQLDLESPKCSKALEKQLGLTDATPKGSGPAPKWALSNPFEIYDLDVSPEGHVAIAGEKAVGLVVDGAVKWKAELEEASARVAWWKGCLLTGVGGELRCYDATGAVTWTARVAEGEDAWLSAIELGPEERVTVVTGTGAIVRIDGDACARKADGCATPLATVEALAGAMIEVLPGGAILGTNDSGVALVSAEGKLLATKEAELATSAPKGGLVVAGRDTLRANPACESADDCFAVGTTDVDMAAITPYEIQGVGVAHSDTYGAIHMMGATKWTVDAGNDGDLVGDGTTIYSVGHQLGLDALEAPPQVRAIDAKTGETRWITKLGTERASLLAGYIMVLRGGTLVVATEAQLFAVPVGPG
jgi:outer membrane protein assembly factor BamB